jgi:hypothetical protein
VLAPALRLGPADRRPRSSSLTNFTNSRAFNREALNHAAMRQKDERMSSIKNPAQPISAPKVAPPAQGAIRSLSGSTTPNVAAGPGGAVRSLTDAVVRSLTGAPRVKR